MINNKLCRLILLALPGLAAADQSIADECPPATGIALQVLSSGGPIADDGAFLRFGEASASFSELDFVGLSHFHADHSADFPALLKSGSFENRGRNVTGKQC